jgi:hypothetical protein
MNALSPYLVLHGLDPLLVGLVAGVALSVLVFLALKIAGSFTKALDTDPYALPQNRPATTTVSTKKSVRFRIKVNGTEHALSDSQTVAVLMAVQSGDRAGARSLVQSGLGVSAEVADSIVDALAKTNVP